MRTIYIAVAALILAGCSSTAPSVDSEENAAIRAAGEKHLLESMKRANETKTITAPNGSGSLTMSARTTIVDIARQSYDDLEAAILIIRIKGSIVGDDVAPDEWAVFTEDIDDQRDSLLYGEGVLVQKDDDAQRLDITGHKPLFAVLHNEGWKVYNRAPYFPDAEAEADFHSKRDSLLAYYKQAIR